MALEEFCAKQSSEILHLNRLVNFFLIYNHLIFFFFFFVYDVINECFPCTCRWNSTSMRGNAML